MRRDRCWVRNLLERGLQSASVANSARTREVLFLRTVYPTAPIDSTPYCPTHLRACGASRMGFFSASCLMRDNSNSSKSTAGAITDEAGAPAPTLLCAI